MKKKKKELTIFEAMQKVIDDFKRMTQEEKIESLKHAGILTKKGKLAAKYGGPGYKAWLKRHPESYTICLDEEE